MKKLNEFKDGYFCPPAKIEIGDEYRIYQLEHDPFYGQLPEAYRTHEFLSGMSGWFGTSQYRLWHELDLVTLYFSGEFTETNNEEFIDVWDEFFRNFYFGHVYLCYSEEMLNTEIESWKGRDDIDFDKAKGTCKFRLFKKVKQINQDVAEYSSVFTGLLYEIDSRRIPMTRASYNEGKAFIWWVDIAENFIGLEQMYIQTQKLAQKRLLRKEKDVRKSVIEDKSLKSLSPVFSVNATEPYLNNKYDLFDVVPPEAPKTILDSVLAWYQYRTGRLGYVNNMNDKKERLTTGENYKDLHGVTNVQHVMLSKLNSFARVFNEKNEGIQLNFNLSNYGEAQGVPVSDEFKDEDMDNVPDKFENSESA